jgi:hypothetical protein
MNNEQLYKLQKRLSSLNQKLTETDDDEKRKKINYDIRIVKLRMDIERLKNQKSNI